MTRPNRFEISMSEELEQKKIHSSGLSVWMHVTTEFGDYKDREWIKKTNVPFIPLEGQFIRIGVGHWVKVDQVSIIFEGDPYLYCVESALNDLGIEELLELKGFEKRHGVDVFNSVPPEPPKEKEKRKFKTPVVMIDSVPKEHIRTEHDKEYLKFSNEGRQCSAATFVHRVSPQWFHRCRNGRAGDDGLCCNHRRQSESTGIKDWQDVYGDKFNV